MKCSHELLRCHSRHAFHVFWSSDGLSGYQSRVSALTIPKKWALELSQCFPHKLHLAARQGLCHTHLVPLQECALDLLPGHYAQTDMVLIYMPMKELCTDQRDLRVWRIGVVKIDFAAWHAKQQTIPNRCDVHGHISHANSSTVNRKNCDEENCALTNGT